MTRARPVCARHRSVASRLYFAEPQAAYATRPPVVVDASVIAAIVFAEPELELAHARLGGFAAVAPALLDIEIANVVVTRLRRRTIAPDVAIQVMQDLADLPIERAAVESAELPLLADRFGLTAYDAAYLWLAASLRAPLATLDARLGGAATELLAGRLPRA